MHFTHRELSRIGEVGGPWVFVIDLQLSQMDPLLIAVSKDPNTPPDDFVVKLAATNHHVLVVGRVSIYQYDGKVRVMRWSGGDIARRRHRASQKIQSIMA